MNANHEATMQGVANAWSWWLSQHDVSVPETIEDAVKAAVTDWLNCGGGDVIAAAVAEAVRRHG